MNFNNFSRNMSRSNRDVCYQSEKDRYDKFDSFDQSSKGGSRSSLRRSERDFGYEDTPHPNAGGSNKFDFEAPDNGFESDFNTAPEKNLRFSTDFTVDKMSSAISPSAASAGAAATATTTRLNQNTHAMPIRSNVSSTEIIATPPQQKLRFDDKITVSKFDLFEDDDFSKAEFSFQNDDQWIEELPKKNNLKSVTAMAKHRHDNIKKSESVNIFARNNDDPFEDDDFFNKTSNEQQTTATAAAMMHNSNFAKFDDKL